MFKNPLFKFSDVETDHKLRQRFRTSRTILSSAFGGCLGFSIASAILGNYVSAGIAVVSASLLGTSYFVLGKIYMRDLNSYIDFMYLEIERVKWQAEEDIRLWARENNLNEEWEVLKVREYFEERAREREKERKENEE